QNVPPYVLFSDATLRDLCRYFPETKADMLDIKGIGERKFEKYGDTFLSAIQDWRQDHPNIQAKVNITSTPHIGMRKAPKQENEEPRHLVSYQSFQSGKTIQDNATNRGLSQQTIEGHICSAYK